MSSWLRPWWGKVVVGLLLVSVTMTGVMNLALSAPRLSFQLLTPEDVAFGNHMRLALPVNAYILSTDRHNNPLLMFADRKMLMSFAGWYVNYGSDWPQTYNDRTEMLAGASGAADLINQYGVNFAAFTDADIYSGSVNQTFFSEHYTLFVHEANWWVYRLR